MAITAAASAACIERRCAAIVREDDAAVGGRRRIALGLLLGGAIGSHLYPTAGPGETHLDT